jgi:hypothetical protein
MYFNYFRNGEFDAILKSMVHNKSQGEFTNQRILVIDAGLKDGQVPLWLTHDSCFKLHDIGGLGNINKNTGFPDNEDLIMNKNLLTDVFHGDSNAILKLFCFMVGLELSLF